MVFSLCGWLKWYFRCAGGSVRPFLHDYNNSLSPISQRFPIIHARYSVQVYSMIGEPGQARPGFITLCVSLSLSPSKGPRNGSEPESPTRRVRRLLRRRRVSPAGTRSRARSLARAPAHVAGRIRVEKRYRRRGSPVGTCSRARSRASLAAHVGAATGTASGSECSE